MQEQWSKVLGKEARGCAQFRDQSIQLGSCRVWILDKFPDRGICLVFQQEMQKESQ